MVAKGILLILPYQLDLELVEPDDTQRMGEVIGRAKVCLSSVVYPIDGDAVIQACIEQRTDYVDWSVLPLSRSHLAYKPILTGTSQRWGAYAGPRLDR